MHFVEGNFVFVEVVLEGQTIVGVYRGENCVRVDRIKIGELEKKFLIFHFQKSIHIFFSDLANQ